MMIGAQAQIMELDDIVKLDVGGCLYTTTRSTLTRYSDSKLGKMFTSLHVAGGHDRDDVTACVIDADGPIFRHVLNFLRRGKLILPDDFKEWELLASEADFYQLKKMADSVRHLASQRNRLEFLEITVRGGNWFTFSGSREALEGTPGLLQFLGRQDSVQDGFPLRRSDILKRVGEDGRYAVSLADGEDFSGRRLGIFQQITELGFELKTTFTNNVSVDLTNRSHQEVSWAFTRKAKHGRKIADYTA